MKRFVSFLMAAVLAVMTFVINPVNVYAASDPYEGKTWKLVGFYYEGKEYSIDEFIERYPDVPVRAEYVLNFNTDKKYTIVDTSNGELFFSGSYIVDSDGLVRCEEGNFVSLKKGVVLANDLLIFKGKLNSDDPKPSPEKEDKKESSNFPYAQYLAIPAASSDARDSKVATNVIVDPDTFKSEAPSKTVMSTNTMGADKFFDFKVHAADSRTIANQEFLAQTLVGPKVQILLTENVYSRRDLSIAENGSLQALTWNNLPKNQPGPVYAVVYNQIDGAYEIKGILDANGTATFTGFKLRPASTITICK